MGINGFWKRHPKKELQALLYELHERGWRVEDPPKYYKVYCPCPEKHKETIHLTPSNPYYGNDKLVYLRNHTCFGSHLRRVK
jgi:hypothetical protein